MAIGDILYRRFSLWDACYVGDKMKTEIPINDDFDDAIFSLVGRLYA